MAENDITAQTEAPESSSAQAAPTEKRRYQWLAVLSLLLCVASWFAATKSGYGALVVAAASIVSGSFALGSRRAAVRNTAITSIIASAVLFLVVGAFIIALRHFLK